MCNKFVFLLILIFGLVCVGGVSANDQLSLNTTDVNTDSELNTGISSQLGENDGSVVSDDGDFVDGVVTVDPVYYDRVSDSGVIVENNGPKSLNDLKGLINSGSGDIELNDDYKYNWLSDMGFDGISINGGDYVINGNNHTIDGGSHVSLFKVNGGSLTLLNINFVNFKGDGAVVYAKNCDLNITQCSLVNNTAVTETYNPIEKKMVINPLLNSYGVVYLDGVNASISVNGFYNNAAKYGAAVYACNSNLALVGNVFGFNVANSCGGAIYSANSRISSLSNAFVNNSANYGGAIYFDETSFDSSVIMDNFMNNTASYGGAIYSLTTNGAFVLSSIFVNNTASWGNSINVADGVMISQGNTFDNESGFVPSFSSVCGNCVFMNMDVQNTTNADNTTVPIVHLVEAIRVDLETVNYNYEMICANFTAKTGIVPLSIRYTANSYVLKNYYNNVSLSCINMYLERLSGLKNQSADLFAVSSLMSVFVEIEKELIASAKANDTGNFNVVMDVCTDNDLENAINVAQYGYYYNPFSDSFEKVSALVVNFEKNHVFNFNTRSDGSVFNVGIGTLILNGDNTTFNVVNHNDRDEFHFMYIGADSMVVTSSLIISGFNTAIENYGMLCILNTTFINNKLHYIIDSDNGGAIKNYGYVMGQNSSFINNYAKYGGALYNEGYVNLVNCTFLNNEGYGEGDDIYNFNKGKSDLTNASCSIVSDEGLNIYERIALKVGGAILATVAAIAVGWIPCINVGAVGVAVTLGSVVGSLILGGAYALDGYLNHDVNSIEILIAATVGAGIGAVGGYMGWFMVVYTFGVCSNVLLGWHVMLVAVIKGVVFATAVGIVSGVFIGFTVPDEVDVPPQNTTIPNVGI